MQTKKTWALRRVIETLVITLISSLTIYILGIVGIIPSTRGGYIGGFGASALIFLILHYRVLYTHFGALRFDITKYLTVNLSIFGAMAVTSIIGLRCFSDDVYTALFGFTKPFRQIFDMSPFGSAILFWTLYLILIIFVLIKILYFDWGYRHFLEEQYDREIEIMEENAK